MVLTAGGPKGSPETGWPDDGEARGERSVKFFVTTIEARPAGPVARLQRWYDRLSDRHRLLLGLATILFFASCWLYVLALSSAVIVSQDSTDLSLTATPESMPTLFEAPVEPTVAVASEPTATPVPLVPAMDPDNELIAPPDVPEVAIIPRAPLPLKPRVVATYYVPDHPVAPSGAQPTRPPILGTVAPFTTPQATRPPIFVNTPVAPLHVTPGAPAPTAIRTMAPVSTPAAPPAVPTRAPVNVVPPPLAPPVIQPTAAPTAVRR